MSDYLTRERSAEDRYLMIWLECMEQFANISLDYRSELRNSAIQSLSRALNSQISRDSIHLYSHSQSHSQSYSSPLPASSPFHEKWNIILERVLVRLLVETPKKFHNYQLMETD